MRLQNLGVLATLASVAPGFLLPPSISEADADIINTLPFEDAVTMESRVISIDCPGCPVVSSIESKTHVAETDSTLKLNFSVSDPHGAGRDTLLLNGVQIYPIDPFGESFMEPLTANQMIKGENDIWEYAATPKLGYSVSVRRPATSDQALELVAVHVEIVEVADVFLTKIPQVELKLLQTPSGKLMIGDVGILAVPKMSLDAPSDAGQECTTIVCKWRAIIADRISQLKGWKMGKGGCGGKMPAAPADMAAGPDAEPKQHHGHHGPRPHTGGRPSHHPHHHGHHGKHGSFARILRGVLLHIFVPVLIGIMCGITASLIGMVVGHIAIFVWRALFRRGENNTRYHRVKGEVVKVDEGNEEEKGLIDNQGPPPEYIEAVAPEEEKK